MKSVYGLIAGALLVLPMTANGEGQGFSMAGPNGATYDLMRIHGSAERPVASLLITRADGGATLMDQMTDCASGQYVYLAMDHAPELPVTADALDQLAQYSSNILSSSLRALTFTPITDDPYDAPMAAVRDLVCGA